MNDKLKKMDDYVQKLIAEYGEDWPYHIPIYYADEISVLEQCGYDTEGISAERCGEMFQCIVTDLVCGRDKDAVTLPGLCSTCSVMDWIEAPGCPDMEYQHFDFPDDKILGGYFKGLPRSIVVSRKNPDWLTLELHPVEEWHEVTPTQKRLACGTLGWYARIQGEFYWMTA